MTSFHELWARVEILESHPSLAPVDLAIPGTSADPGTTMVSSPMLLASGISACAFSVTLVHFIPRNIKKFFLEGEDVNLASLPPTM